MRMVTLLHKYMVVVFFHAIGSMVFNEDGRFYESGEWVKMMYGAFTGPL